MKKKKIAILTFHNSINYGAVLQTYAMYKTIEKYEAEAYILNYKNKKIEENEKMIKKSNLNAKGLLKILSQGPFTRLKKAKFKKFIAEQFSLLEDINKISNNIDGIVVGSDQVWNHKLTNYDYTYYLKNINVDKKISYAASFGDVDLDTYDISSLKPYLDNFNAISIREQNNANKLNDEYHINSLCHLDPVFLLDSTQWSKLIKSKKLIKEDYILVYYIKKSYKLFEYAAKLSKEKHMSVYLVNQNIIKGNYGFKYLRGKGLDEFLNYVKNASYIVTNSFHGTAFSIIFNKSFKSEKLIGEKENSRVMNILTQFGLTNRVIEDISHIDMPIDYEFVRSKVNLEVNRSNDYIRESLEI